MGKFSGVLIVSDIDGTLYDSKGQLRDENREALAWFKSEGGLFTLASGRTLSDVTKIDDELRLANTSLIGSNGAFIGRADALEWQCRFGADLAEAIALVMEHVPYCDAEFVNAEYIAAYRPTELTELHKKYVSDRFEYLDSLDQIPEETAMVSFWMEQERIPEFKETFARLGLDQRYEGFQGFTYAYEMVPKGLGKGAAALRLKEMTGCHTLVCAGDSGNDVSMLKIADFSFAPRDAMAEAKEAAKQVLERTCDESIYPEILGIVQKNGGNLA